MKTILKIAILSIVLIGCGSDDNVVVNNNNDNNNSSTDDSIVEDVFNAKVLYIGIDCGDTFLIQFNDNAINVPENYTDNIFYAINLPEEYKIEGLDINVNFREPYEEETMVCSMMGFGYPQIFIESEQ